MWFADMANCIYNHFMLEQDVCGELLGLCYKKRMTLVERVSDWTCEECTDILARTADYMAAEDTIAEGVAYLQAGLNIPSKLRKKKIDIIYPIFLSNPNPLTHYVRMNIDLGSRETASAARTGTRRIAAPWWRPWSPWPYPCSPPPSWSSPPSSARRWLEFANKFSTE